MELQSQIDATRRSLASEVQSISANSSVQLHAPVISRRVPGRRHGGTSTRLLERRGLQDQEAKLVLELQSAQATYKKGLDGYDQIMFASSGNYTDVSLISRADPPPKPDKPNKLKLFAIACLFSLGSGSGRAVRLRTVSESPPALPRRSREAFRDSCPGATRTVTITARLTAPAGGSLANPRWGFPRWPLGRPSVAGVTSLDRPRSTLPRRVYELQVSGHTNPSHLRHRPDDAGPAVGGEFRRGPDPDPAHQRPAVQLLRPCHQRAVVTHLAADQPSFSRTW